MSTPSHPVGVQTAPDPQTIFDTATGFMRAKHLFAASELGIFGALADGPRSLAEVARDIGLPPRTARIIIDANVALGFLERQGDRYQNGAVAQFFLAGRGPADMRPFVRFWNRLSYRRWITLEDSVRLGRGVSGEFNFTPDEQQIFSKGVEAFSNSQAAALADAYDFGQHARIMDVGGGTGSFLRAIMGRHPRIQGTLYELPTAAAVARQQITDSDLRHRIHIVEGDFLRDSIPAGHDAFILANVVHVLQPEGNLELLRRVRASAASRARLLLVDLWTNPEHTEPVFAALMAAEFLVVGGNGDVYSTDELKAWLHETGWSFVEHRPLAGPVSVIVAETARM